MTWTDVRHACRTIAAMPIVAAVIIVSLGIGIGVNTAVFSWIQAFVFQPLPGVANSGTFHFVEPRAETGTHPGASWLEYRDLRDRLPSFHDLTAFRMVPLNVGEASRTERTYAQLVSGNFFSVLGLRPALGRLLTAEDAARPGGEPVVVISDDYWQTRFNRAPSAVGSLLRANNRDLTIVGVAPPAFQGTVLGLQFDLWVPATLAPVLLAGSRELDDRTLRGYSIIGRLQPEAPRARAQAELDRAMRELAESYPDTNRSMTADVLPFWRAPRGPQGMFLQALGILQAIMLLLLLAVCGNTANLMLARASARQREIGVRLALGAAPSRIVRLLLTENLILALTGAALGAAIAVWGTQALRAVRLSTAFPVRFQTSVDMTGLAFAILLGVGCALVFGAAPAAQLARVDPQRALRAGLRAPARSRLRSALMAVEVALALAVLLVAGLFFRSFRETRDTDPGFRRDGVLLAAYDLTGRNLDDALARNFASRLVARLSALPAVEAASIAVSVPLDIHGMPLQSFTVEGRARADGTLDRALRNTVTPGYFKTMGIPFAAGTDFADLDDTAAPPQVIVNEEFARRFLDGAASIGRRIDARGRAFSIAGVVRNSLYESFGEAPVPIIYFSYRDRPAYAGEIHLRTRAGNEQLLAPEVRRVVRELDSALPVYNVRTLSEHVETNLFLRRIPARMFVVLGPLLLLLAAIGIYAVVAYAVAHRTTEIGVRLALGATPRRVVAQVVRETLTVISAGAVAGWLVVFMLYTHLVRGAAVSIPVFVGVPAILLVVAAFASWLPARRAAGLDPMIALRRE